jgi:putative transferase (TIGR04331 family)
MMLGFCLDKIIIFLFDKWEQFKKVEECNEKFSVNIITSEDKYLASNDSLDLNSRLNDDKWNYLVSSLVLFEYKNCFKEINSCAVREEKRTNKKQPFKQVLKKNLNKILWLFKRNDKYTLMSSGLSIIDESLLNIKFRQVPSLGFMQPGIKEFKYNQSIRAHQVEVDISNDSFIRFIGLNIFKFLPKIFLEGFEYTLSEINKNPFPKKPKAIFTSYLHFDNDMFKIWSANMHASGSKLIVGQHGGQLQRFNSDYSYERRYADILLCWGNYLPSLKSRNIGEFKGIYKFENKITNKINGHVLLIATNMPKYNFMLRSMALGDQIIDYHYDQIYFYKSLENNIQKNFMLRPYFQDFGWNINQIWKKEAPEILFDNENKLYKSLKKSRIAISTYNATNFIELLILNYPVIIFWDNAVWPIDEMVKKDFYKLEEVGIFHNNYKNAAQHLSHIYDDINSWWFSKEVQDTRSFFLRRHACKNKHYLRDIKRILNTNNENY